MPKPLNFTQSDAWAALLVAALPEAFPTTPLSLRYGSAEALGDTPLGQLHAANFLQTAGVISFNERFCYCLTDHPLALAIKELAALAVAELAIDTAAAARQAFELLTHH
ncbi:hypothetical protein [Aquabacterium sp.]|uniref:hypothetical protein n=1 Tax=Aquabacterium sp. TaxID=1872578 RepID=UPI002609716A|nr:hypothetical protein [Aquabacterium sp.]MDD2978227.1 hypothetical protein [Aquabacterium sp.]